MAAESGAATSAPNTGVPVVKAPAGAPKPVEDVVNYSKRSVADEEFFADIPPDELLEAMADDEPAKRKPRPKLERDAPKPKARKPEPEPEEEDEEEEELAASADEEPEAEPDPEPEPEEAVEEAAPKGWSVPEGKGTKDAPLSLKDLPEDVFLELQVNGQKVVVDLKEGAKGIMRRQAFDQGMSKAKTAITDAHKIAEDAVSAQERMKAAIEQTRQGFEAFVKNPKRVLAALFDNVQDRRRVLEVMLEDHEDALEEISFGYAEFRQREDSLQKDGYQQGRARRAQAREAQRRQREQADLESQRRQVQEERQRWQAEQVERQRAQEAAKQTESAAQAAFVALKPGLDSGLVAVGLHDVAKGLKPMPEDMVHEIKVRLDVARRLKGSEPITADDMKQAVIRAAKALDIKPEPPKRPAPAGSKPAPRQPTQTPSRQAASGGGRSFEDVPQSRRVRDLEWYLNG